MSRLAGRPVLNKRRAARFAAVQALYQVELIGRARRTRSAASSASIAWRRLFEPFEVDEPSPEVDREWFEILVEGAWAARDRLDPEIERCLAEGWTLARCGFLLRACLRAGAFELRRAHRRAGQGGHQRVCRARPPVLRRERAGLRQRGARPAGDRAAGRRGRAYEPRRVRADRPAAQAAGARLPGCPAAHRRRRPGRRAARPRAGRRQGRDGRGRPFPGRRSARADRRQAAAGQPVRPRRHGRRAAGLPHWSWPARPRSTTPGCAGSRPASPPTRAGSAATSWAATRCRRRGRSPSSLTILGTVPTGQALLRSGAAARRRRLGLRHARRRRHGPARPARPRRDRGRGAGPGRPLPHAAAAARAGQGACAGSPPPRSTSRTGSSPTSGHILDDLAASARSLDASAVPLSPVGRGVPGAREAALTGGDDYELLFTAPTEPPSRGRGAVQAPGPRPDQDRRHPRRARPRRGRRRRTPGDHRPGGLAALLSLPVPYNALGSITIGRRPVSSRTRLAMCSVPPGPSPAAAVPQASRTRPWARRGPGPCRASSGCSGRTCPRPWAAGPARSSMTRTACALAATSAKARSQRWSGSAKVTELRRKAACGWARRSSTPHAAGEAGFREQEVAAAGAAADAEIAGAGADLVERGRDPGGRGVGLGGREARRLGAAGAAHLGVVDHVAAEQDDLGRLGRDGSHGALPPSRRSSCCSVRSTMLSGLGDQFGPEAAGRAAAPGSAATSSSAKRSRWS